jgi:hypothetical protein
VKWSENETRRFFYANGVAAGSAKPGGGANGAVDEVKSARNVLCGLYREFNRNHQCDRDTAGLVAPDICQTAALLGIRSPRWRETAAEKQRSIC